MCGDGTYALVASYTDNGVQVIDVSDPSSLVAMGTASDGYPGFIQLEGPHGVATFVIGASTYAIVASYLDDGVQVMNVSNPSSLVGMGSATDGVDGFDELEGAHGIATFVLGSSTYAIVASQTDNGVQVIDVSDPSSLVAMGSATDGNNDFGKLDGAFQVATFVVGGSTYAIVASVNANGVQVFAPTAVLRSALPRSRPAPSTSPPSRPRL